MNDGSVVERSAGTTPSERYLAELCDRSFLRLWSYPNVHFDKRKNGKGDGKELCDLLVVCGDHVLIFSDKTIAWQDGADVPLAWRRWYNRAIHHSARQIRKAERWIRQDSRRIYLDPECTKPFPFELPDPGRRKVHGIIVALGAGPACAAHFGREGSGSLVLRPSIGHDDPSDGDSVPFTIGDVDPDGPFIHVLDDVTLDVVMRELDTITDFTAYLTRKAEFFRSGRLLSADGEEDLVAYYMTHLNPRGQHDFVHPRVGALTQDDAMTIGPGRYANLRNDPRYLAKKVADEDSYVWDRLIESFSDHMRGGTSVTVDGRPFVLSQAERAVRHMALEPRFARRLLGRSILEAFSLGRDAPRFTRWLLPSVHSHDRQTAFFFTTLAPPGLASLGSYDRYRTTRRRLMEVQALAALKRWPTLRRIVGVATEPALGGPASEDVILVEDVEWTPEIVSMLDERMRLFNVMQAENMRLTPLDEWEFPASDATGTNRSLRRAMRAKGRRKR